MWTPGDAGRGGSIALKSMPQRRARAVNGWRVTAAEDEDDVPMLTVRVEDGAILLDRREEVAPWLGGQREW